MNKLLVSGGHASKGTLNMGGGLPNQNRSMLRLSSQRLDLVHFPGTFSRTLNFTFFGEFSDLTRFYSFRDSNTASAY